MDEKSLDFGELVDDEGGETTSPKSDDGPTQVHVKTEYGTELYTSKKHNCSNCHANMECVVVVDRMGRQDEGLDEVMIPSCEGCKDEIAESAKREHYDTRIER